MTELELYEFIQENDIEYHSFTDEYNQKDFLIFLRFSELKDFTKILGYNFLEEEGYDIVLKQDYVCIAMRDICEYFDIDMKNIFKKEKK